MKSLICVIILILCVTADGATRVYNVGSLTAQPANYYPMGMQRYGQQGFGRPDMGMGQSNMGFGQQQGFYGQNQLPYGSMQPYYNQQLSNLIKTTVRPGTWN